MVPAVVVVLAVAVVFAVGQVVLAVVAHQIRQGEAVVGGDEVHRTPQGHGLAVIEIGTALEPLGQAPGAVVVPFPEAPHPVAEMAVPGADPLGGEVVQPIKTAAVPRFAHQFEITQLRVGLHCREQGRLIQGFELVAAAQGNAQIEAEAIHPQFQGPAAHRLEDQLGADRRIGGDRVAAAAHILIVAVLVLVVVDVVGATPPAQGGAMAVALGGVVVDHIQQHFDAGVVAGGHQLAHLMAGLQRIATAAVAVVGCEPAQGAVPPHVVAARGGIGRVEAEHRQQLHRRDAQLLEVGQLLDQAQVGAAVFHGDPGILTAGEAPHMQLVDHRALPAVARARMGLKIEQIPFAHHRLEAGMGVG